jgi:hypothetical protein
VIYANAGSFYSGSPLVIDPSTPSTLYRINPLQKSTDGGITWTGLRDPITNGGKLPLLWPLTRGIQTLCVGTWQE